MPEKKTLERVHQDAREGKSATIQAGEFVREEMHHVREGKHGAASTKQAIAIGLYKARRAGVKLPTPRRDSTSEETREKAMRDLAKGETGSAEKVSAKRSRATSEALKKKGHAAASKSALAKQARSSAQNRGPAARHEAALKGSRTRKAA